MERFVGRWKTVPEAVKEYKKIYIAMDMSAEVIEGLEAQWNKSELKVDKNGARWVFCNIAVAKEGGGYEVKDYAIHFDIEEGTFQGDDVASDRPVEKGVFRLEGGILTTDRPYHGRTRTTVIQMTEEGGLSTTHVIGNTKMTMVYKKCAE